MGQANGHAHFPDLPLWQLVCDPDAEDPVEDLIYRFFQLHDLNGNGVLEELELIQLNKKIAMLHYGRDTDKEAVRAKFQNLFRTEFDPEGRPVEYATFRKHIRKLFLELRIDQPQEQAMMLDHWMLEAVQARHAFHEPSMESATDAPFLKTISFDADASLEKWVNSPCKGRSPGTPRARGLSSGSWCSLPELLQVSPKLQVSPTASTAASPGASSTDLSAPASPTSGSVATEVRAASVAFSDGVSRVMSEADSLAVSMSPPVLAALRGIVPDLPGAVAGWRRQCEKQLCPGEICAALFRCDEDEDEEDSPRRIPCRSACQSCSSPEGSPPASPRC